MPPPRRSSERLRKQLVRQLSEKGVMRSEAVRAAFLTVRREQFLPRAAAENGLAAIYRDEAIVTKRDERGMPLSSSSQPALMTEMLELLNVRPGHHVLEIGAGTGYNAALLCHLAGAGGRVTTIDIDSALVRQARRALRDAGYRATVKLGDGREGHADRAPYDRIIVTACADQLAAAWHDQLAEGGRLLLPVRLDPDGAAIQIIPAFERNGRRLRSVGLTWGGFMPLHNGDGGWRPPPSALSASHRSNGKHTPLASLSGAGLRHLSASSARELLAAILSRTGPPRRRGLTDLSSRQPPMLLLYLLLTIPATRRVSFSTDARMGIGLVEPRSHSLAVVSLRSPWRTGHNEPDARARWRLDAYGTDAAATDLEQLLDDWQDLQRRGHTTLQIAAAQRNGNRPLSFAWSSNGNQTDRP